MWKDLFSGLKRAQAMVAVLCAAGTASALAIPQLQLDAVPGLYTDQTVYATQPKFDLYAYFYPGGDKENGQAIDPTIGDLFHLSIAVVPKTSSPASLGSITVNGDPINVTGGMTLGAPELLPPHGIFDTYFLDKTFFFDLANEAAPYNTADEPGTGPTDPVPGQGVMYFHKFAIDATDLLADGIHFDLYVYGEKCNGNGDGDDCKLEIAKAPFSHDAQFDPDGGGGGGQVPEPGVLALLGLALAGVAFTRRRTSA